jgi:hypothetical protein
LCCLGGCGGLPDHLNPDAPQPETIEPAVERALAECDQKLAEIKLILDEWSEKFPERKPENDATFEHITRVMRFMEATHGQRYAAQVDVDHLELVKADLERQRRKYEMEDGDPNEANRAVWMALRKPIVLVDFKWVSLEGAIQWLRDATDTGIVVKWSELEAAGVMRDTEFMLLLRNKKLETVLKQILSIVGGENSLVYAVEDGAIVISTRADLDEAAGGN